LTVIRNSVVIRAPKADVFDRLADPRSELEWNPKVEQMELVGDEPVSVGSRFRAKWKLSQPLNLAVTRFDRPGGWSTETDGPITVNLDVDLEDHPDGTKLRTAFDAAPHGKGWLFFPVFLLLIRREEKQNMAHIKAWLEAGP
jgi:Polyketide cyclase / dehydrase and lipid transport